MEPDKEYKNDLDEWVWYTNTVINGMVPLNPANPVVDVTASPNSSTEKEFEPFVFYNGDGDEIEVFITPDDSYGQWINPHLTIYYKEGDEKQAVGLCIHGVTGLINKEKDMKMEVCHKCGHPVTEDCIRDKYCTRCGEAYVATLHHGHEGMSRMIRYNGTLFDQEHKGHECYYSPTDGWFEHLNTAAHKKAMQWADEMAECFVCDIRNGPKHEISIPKHWMIPDFADKVLFSCTAKGIHYTKIKETQNQIFVTRGQPQPPRKRPVLIIIHKAVKWTSCDSGEDILINALDSSYIANIGFDNATIREQVRRAFDTGKNMVVTFDYHEDIEILRDIVVEYNAIVLDTQCKIHRG